MLEMEAQEQPSLQHGSTGTHGSNGVLPASEQDGATHVAATNGVALVLSTCAAIMPYYTDRHAQRMQLLVCRIGLLRCKMREAHYDQHHELLMQQSQWR